MRWAVGEEDFSELYNLSYGNIICFLKERIAWLCLMHGHFIYKTISFAFFFYSKLLAVSTIIKLRSQLRNVF